MKHVRSTALIFCSIFAVSAAGKAAASTISIVGDLEYRDGEAVVTVVNRGDEEARNLQVEVSCLGVNRFGKLVPSLPSGEGIKERFDFAAAAAPLPGMYPILARIRYSDANGYPFAALIQELVQTGEGRRDSSVYLSGSSLDLAGAGEIQVRLANRGSAPRRFRVELALAPEFGVESPVREIELPSGEEALLEFPVRTMSALPGSVYPYYLTAEYEENGFHYCADARGRVIVHSPRGGGRLFFWAASAAVLGAVLIFLIVIVRRAGRAGKGASGV
ncbi:MAG TPA: hypothetical protein PLI51_10580 [bacterium]|nr:hypothetical protein [bacterium]HPQ67161.1 hypothetical protein [bacterium]